MKQPKPKARSVGFTGPKQEGAMARSDRNKMKTYDGDPRTERGRVLSGKPRKRKSYGA